MPSPPSYGCCTRVNFVLKKHLLFQMNLSNSGLKNRSIKEYWLIFTVLKFPLGLQFSHNLTKFKIIKYISTIYIMTTTCTYLQQLTQVSDVAHGPLVNFQHLRSFTFAHVEVSDIISLEPVNFELPSTTSEETVTITPPCAYTGPAPVKVRLISHVLREGQVIFFSW